MFQLAQEGIGLGQLAAYLVWQQATFSQARQHRAGWFDLQAMFTAAANQLKHLGNEFDFANPARAELDVIRHLLTFDLAADLRMQFAHGIDGAVVEILAEHKRTPDRFPLIQPLPTPRPRL